MDLASISKSTPIEPYINEDGYYPQCRRCWTELTPEEEVCNNCNQVQDWSWLHKK